MRPAPLTWWAALFCGACLSGSPLASAQTDEQKASARSLATQGLEAFNAQRWDEAADLFGRAESLVHSATHLLYLARALEKQQKLVRAREAYLKITREQLEPNAPAAVKQAHQDAKNELAALEPRIPMLKVTVENAPQGAAPSVTVDGNPLPPAVIGVPAPVDPGKHQLRASAPGMQSEAVSVDVAEGGKQEVALKLVLAQGGAQTGGTTESAASSVGGSGGSVEAAPGGPNTLRIAGFVALGVGVVGVGAGTFFAIQSSSKTGEWKDICGGTTDQCPLERKPEIESLKSDADSAASRATIAFIVGGVGLAAGTTLLLLSFGHDDKKGARVVPYVGPSSIGVGGRF